MSGGGDASAVSVSEARFRSDVVREANAYVEVLALLDSHDDETAFRAVKAIVRCLGTAVMSGEALYVGACAADRAVMAAGMRDPAAALRFMEWAHSQFQSTGARLAALVGHAEGGVAMPAIVALSEVMTLLVGAAGEQRVALPKEWLETVSMCFFPPPIWHVHPIGVCPSWDLGLAANLLRQSRDMPRV